MLADDGTGQPMNLDEREREALREGFTERVGSYVRYGRGKPLGDASPSEVLEGVALVCREWMVDRMLATEARARASGSKRVYYLSLEFLIGRSLEASLRSLGAHDAVAEALAAAGVDLEGLYEHEQDAALGNGGLGRLAACYLDSLATLGLPGCGYGINYEHGLFRQVIENEAQSERPDTWRRFGSPWLIPRTDDTVAVPVYGRAGRRPARGRSGSWTNPSIILGTPHDLPIVGFGGETVNWLRLYSAGSPEPFDFELFNRAEYLKAFAGDLASQRISKLLYPSSSTEAGRELRLLQEYFFVACAIGDVLRRHLEKYGLERLPEKVAIQLNDTHPALAVAELVRVLVDEHGFSFERALDLTRATLAFTNHTLLPEALETWPRPLLARVIPRHLQVIEEINAGFLADVKARFPDDVDRLRRLSVIEESQPKRIRMANLAIIGSHTVNGVSELHSDLIRTQLVPDFADLWPDRFTNVTNGITPRRWLLQANPGLSGLLTDHLGDEWVTELGELSRFESAVEDASVREHIRRIKRDNKTRLADLVRETTGRVIDPDSLFDVQVKRFHMYKRQLLAALHAIHLYLRVADGDDLGTPRTCVFAGKAAPEYDIAKRVIRLVNAIARVVDEDPRTQRRLRVVFVPDYRVSVAEIIIPAADLSEQISTAGFEASGTGNMKFALNGALTIGTLDGANIEIRDAVGSENIYIFGHRADEIRALRPEYDPHRYVAESPALARVIDALSSTLFANDSETFSSLLHHLFEERDPFCVLADFEDYRRTQERVADDYRDADGWSRRAGLNFCRMGRFSSDRAVREYAERIWRV